MSRLSGNEIADDEVAPAAWTMSEGRAGAGGAEPFGGHGSPRVPNADLPVRCLPWALLSLQLLAGCGANPEVPARRALRVAAPAEFEAWQAAVEAREAARRAAGPEALEERAAALEWAQSRIVEAKAARTARMTGADAALAVEVERVKAEEAAEVERANAREAAEVESVKTEGTAAIGEVNARERMEKDRQIPTARAAMDAAMASAVEVLRHDPEAGRSHEWHRHEAGKAAFAFKRLAEEQHDIQMRRRPEFGPRLDLWKPGMVSWHPSGSRVPAHWEGWAAPALEAHRKAWAGYYAAEAQAETARREARSRAEAARRAARTTAATARREARMRGAAARRNVHEAVGVAREEAAEREDVVAAEVLATYEATGSPAVLAFEAAAESETAAQRRLAAAAPEAWAAYVAAEAAWKGSSGSPGE